MLLIACGKLGGQLLKATEAAPVIRQRRQPGLHEVQPGPQIRSLQQGQPRLVIARGGGIPPFISLVHGCFFLSVVGPALAVEKRKTHRFLPAVGFSKKSWSIEL